MMEKNFDAIIIGAGLAGLTAAAFLAKAGLSVAVLEKASHPGGRARTEKEKGFSMNLGPHALYKNGEAIKILRELGVPLSGKSPSGKYGFAIKEGKLHRLPYNASSLMNTTLIGWMEKWELFRFLTELRKLETEHLQNQTFGNWLLDKFRSPGVRDFIAMITRVATYTNNLDRLSAGAALGQVKIAAEGNVLYLDGGWQVLVDELRGAAETAGAKIFSQTRVAELIYDSAVRGVRVTNGNYFSANNVAVATSPAEAAELLGKSPSTIRNLLLQMIPVKMSSLTVGLKHLPAPDTLLAFGIDQPLYFSVHSKWATLTETEGSALIHAGKYLPAGKVTDPEQDRKELEQMLDLCQPGWRDELVASSYLPQMKVSNSLVTAGTNGMKGRPGIDWIDVRGLYVCGDWVGDRGMLCDASLASAKAVAQRVVKHDIEESNQESLKIVRSA
jgi:phytoene dehydrogenase-like protein